MNINKAELRGQKIWLNFKLLLFWDRRLLFLLFFFFQLPGKVTFTIAVHLRLVFVYTENPGYIAFIHKIFSLHHKRAECL